MKNLFKNIKSCMVNGEDLVLVTVVASSGSTPRGAGARMIVTEKGRLYGTVGGGAVEYKCEEIAKNVLLEKSNTLEEFKLYKNQVADLGMVCGGDVSIYFQYISCQDKEIANTVDKALNCFLTYKRSWLVYNISKGKLYITEEYNDNDNIAGDMIFAEHLIEPGYVHIFGGGHVAQALVPVLSSVGFNCIVYDDREDFSKPELFPGAIKVETIALNNMPKDVKITKDDFVCIMTRGHKDDYEVEKQVLKTEAHYIGVIGSRRKIQSVNQRLMEDGYTMDDINRITTPIGLDILAETPAEIAISIAAQMIEVRALKMGSKHK